MIPKPRVVFDDPEPVAQSEIMRVDICAEITVTCQQSASYSRGIRDFAVMQQGRLVSQQILPLIRSEIPPACTPPCKRLLFFKNGDPLVWGELGERAESLEFRMSGDDAPAVLEKAERKQMLPQR